MRARIVLVALAVSTFFYVTVETLPIGLLPQIADGVHVPDSAVGLLVTAYGLVVVVATIPRVARKGRASYLGERSAGHQDPGATSTHLLLKAAADAWSRA